MIKHKKAFTLIELLVVVAIIALLISILLPSLQRARELSKRTVCSANIRGIGQACKIYSNEDTQDMFPLVPYDYTQKSFNYTKQIGCSRSSESNTSSVSLSTTRNLWLLIRGTGGGSITVKQFRCPSSEDSPDDTEDLARYYDFQGYTTISYGYHVPYGSTNQSRPSEDMDIRMGIIADKGPFAWAEGVCNTSGKQRDEPAIDFEPGGQREPRNDQQKNLLDRWVAFNSPNHGGRNNGEGQNVLFGDSHVEFAKKPIVGVDQDNIYARMIQRAVPPWKVEQSQTLSANPIPGKDVLDNRASASTDTLIYP